MTTKAECPYCGATEGLRIKCGGGGFESPEYTCEACFIGIDTGPSFDDLPICGDDSCITEGF